MAAAPLTEDDLRAYRKTLSNWGRWGPEDELGALNFITPAKRAAAASLVREGLTVPCSLALPTSPGVDNPHPVAHLMLVAGDVSGRQGALEHTSDFFAIAPHGMATTHLDALCHVLIDGQMYNGFPASEVCSDGAHRCSIMTGAPGIVSRGVLLDVPGLRGVDYLEGGEAIAPEELDRAEERQGVRVEEGDILLIHTGRDRRRAAVGRKNAMRGLAGLHAACLPWLHRRGVALLGCDGISDVSPSGVEGWVMPIHQIGIVDLGLHLLDNARLDLLVAACRERSRWEFLMVIAPLQIERGTASPVNPVALF